MTRERRRRLPRRRRSVRDVPGRERDAGPDAAALREAFANQWFDYLEEADYVGPGAPISDDIPWVTYMETWFNQNYALAAHLEASGATPGSGVRSFYIYRRTG